MRTKQFDLIVIGSGTAGSVAAYQCRAAGWTVAVVDKLPFGGTCALRGCDPKKVLVGATELVDWQRRMSRRGVVRSDLRLDWPALMRFKKTFTDPVPAQREEGFKKAGIATFHGSARFVDETTIQIGKEPLVGRRILIATGHRPATLHIPGEEYLTTSDQFLELKRLPKRIAFVGGGYIALEFAHIAARAGVEATVFHRGSRILASFDPGLVKQLTQASQQLGIQFYLDSTVTAIRKLNQGYSLEATTFDKPKTITTDLVVYAAGRVPDLDELDLENGKVRHQTRGVMVTSYLQSVTNPSVYAAGDAVATPGLALTPVAGHEGEIAAYNMLKGNRQKPNYTGLPTVVFTIPSLASVGLSEAEAKKQGLDVVVHHEETGNWYSSRRLGEETSGFKVLVEKKTERILGAHLLGPHVDDVINLFALAIRFQLKASSIRGALYSYPSASGDIIYMI